MDLPQLAIWTEDFTAAEFWNSISKENFHSIEFFGSSFAFPFNIWIHWNQISSFHNCTKKNGKLEIMKAVNKTVATE